MTGNSRAIIVGQVAEAITGATRPHPVRVAIDGRTASGKTTFADELAEALKGFGRPVIRTSIDGFHRPKAERYARGRHSAVGYYHDARDLAAVRRLLLEPLGPDGDRLYRTASFDLEADRPLDSSPALAPADAILVVDGTFLQRPELADAWDITVFIDASAEVAAARAIRRDAARLGGPDAAADLYAVRYGPAFSLYETMNHPALVADIVVHNTDLAAPSVAFRAGRIYARTFAMGAQ